MQNVGKWFVILASVTGLLLPTDSFANAAFAFRLNINAVSGGQHGMPCPPMGFGPGMGAPMGPLQQGIYPGMYPQQGMYGQGQFRMRVAVRGRRRGCGGGGIRIAFSMNRGGGCGGGRMMARGGGCFGRRGRC